ncbi:hypothetical protein EDB19DRAFT_1920993 [Suillus lakei]|nr:hypothetical protein EDB19DRAFT_1920993 [Suillus lakei]
MGPLASIGNNITPGPSVIVEDISTFGPWPAVEETLDEGDIVHRDEPPALPHFDVLPPLDANEETLANDVYANVTLNDLCISLAFIFGLANASLDDPESGLDAVAVECIQNPPQHQLSLDDDLDLRAAVKLYLKLSHVEKSLITVIIAVWFCHHFVALLTIFSCLT